MADNFGVLGSSVAVTVATATVYTCPANKAAKIKLYGSFTGGAGSTITVLVNGVTVALIAAMTSGHFTFTNGGAGLLRAASATAPTGASAAETVQPAAPIYYLSAGQTVQYTVGAAALLAANVQVVGIEVDLTA
jgi:hypothetical protein